MSTEHRDPDQLPEGVSAKGAAAYVGEDVGRQIVGRTALFVAALCVLAGVTSGADQTVRTIGTIVGAAGILSIAVAAMARWRRSRQWLVVLVALATSLALLVVMLAQHRAAL